MADFPVLREDQVEGVLSEVERLAFDIPFENSRFQTLAFVVAAQQTPARAYRAILLRMDDRIRAVKHFMFTKRRNDIDREEKIAKMSLPETSEFDRRRLQVDLDELSSGEASGKKLLNDALVELGVLYVELKKLPEYTRASFEAEEATHFKLKLTRQINTRGNGALESLENMNVDLRQLDALASIAKAAIPGGNKNAPVQS
jgi:hypothetical protein